MRASLSPDRTLSAGAYLRAEIGDEIHHLLAQDTDLVVEPLILQSLNSRKDHFIGEAAEFHFQFAPGDGTVVLNVRIFRYILRLYILTL
jgi:hypothetical protein